jgi:hypothetical protein
MGSVAAGCSGDDGDTDADATRPSASTAAATTVAPTTVASTVPRPDGPAADVSEVIEGDSPPFIGEAAPIDLAAVGYEQAEHVAAGTATAYEPVGDLTGDGEWTLRETTTAPYRTRVLVRRPIDPDRFSGTVVVEWLNVSGGLDAGPDWSSLAEELTREGHIWIGVSAQLIGVAGGQVLVSAPGAEDIVGKGLMTLDPQRYGALDHPGDGFSFDIMTQVARAVRTETPLLGGRAAQFVIAAGESQSAIALTTYYNGVQPLTLAFDAFFVHSRALVALPLVGPGEYADLATGFATVVPTVLRSDLDAPVLELQAESDLGAPLSSAQVRQPDTDRFRLWEVAGTAHADRHTLGPIADLVECGVPVNDAPMHVVAKAAFHALERWMRGGEPPAEAARIAITDDVIVRDADGIAEGGIRTPSVDVPAEVLSGEPGPNDSLLCLLLGSTRPLAGTGSLEATLIERYGSVADYRSEFEAAADATIAEGFALAADRDALLAYARVGD